VYFNVPRGFEEIAQALHADKALAKVFFSRVKMMFYAAASLAQPIWDSLHAAAEKTCGERILMITGLGMTETAPFAAVANWEAGQSGGIGLPAPGVELRLAPVGDKLEVRYRGPSVTPGFWRREQLTRESFDADGFYRSGDAARFLDPADPQRGLVFDGRIAEDFKLDSGTFVSVGPLRARVMAAGTPWVQDAVIAGHNRREITALIIPRAGTPNTPALRAACQKILDQMARDSTGSATRVVRAVLLTDPLSIDAGEITDKGSINQRAVLKAREALVEDLYAEPSPSHIIHLTQGTRP
jgi:feruloyl-CoA synthase